ncbi:MAG: hemolysin family protein [Candidatus Pacebacteria bacterium]|nr:hemolysin family protein [Candidatus Paceibacterota bacterium]
MGHANVLLAVFLLIGLSSIFSGLTLGLFTLNKDDLRRKSELGDKRAGGIYDIRKNGNLLLCTLLIGNVTVNSILSILLGSITSGFIASFLAISLIVVFGEILPQAVFARHALRLGSKFIWVVKIFIFILYPVAKPLSMFLDRLLGEELPTVYSKKELAKIIDQQEELLESVIDADEKRIMKGVLSYSEKTAGEIMTPRTSMVAVDFAEEITQENIDALRDSGHSRIPVYRDNPDNIVGILYAKDLIGKKFAGKKAGDLARGNVIFVNPQKRLDDLLNDFKRTRNHLFIVADKFGSVMGIVTIEDVIEEIIGEEIVDEFDKYEDLQEIAISRIGERVVL